LDVIAPTSGGDYTLGLSSTSSTNDTSLTNDFSFGAVVSVELSYNLNNGDASLTVGGETITSPTAGFTSETLDTFNLRQSSSSSDETIFIDNLSISYDSTLSVDSKSIEGFKMYPNPVSNGFVNLETQNSNSLNVSVFDVLGKQVINTRVLNSRLNVSALRPGIYLLKATQDNASVTKKLVVQ
jgi:hypothetical protein